MNPGISLFLTPFSPSVQVDVDVLSHPGKVRHTNEDQ